MRIAIVGGGVVGITAAYLIQRNHQVTLYEKNGYIGGHTHTITILDGPDAGTQIDTGFIVLNDRTYPILNRFFRDLGVSIRKSDMSFGYFNQKSGFQYASSNLNSLFAQRRNLIAPGHWSMLAEVLLFNQLVLHRLKRGMLAAIRLQTSLACPARLLEYTLLPILARTFYTILRKRSIPKPQPAWATIGHAAEKLFRGLFKSWKKD